LYAVIVALALPVWQLSNGRIQRFVKTSAPAAIERLFVAVGHNPAEALVSELPTCFPLRDPIRTSARAATLYLEHEVRATFGDLLAASRFVGWLLLVPIAAFLLITGAPGFRRSAERLLPHGHLQWRAGEYLHDVNSALAGYVRAQLAAALVVAALCAVGFWLLSVPSAIGLAATAGVLELVPAIGPVAALLMATSQSETGVLAVAGFLGVLRVAQDYVIYPRLVKRGMHLATPVVVVAIWAGAVLAGAIGVIIAIPIAGFLSVSLRHSQEYVAIERVVRDHARQRAADPDATRLARGSDAS
jgi:predicted PurR-regulated permease PerM